MKTKTLLIAAATLAAGIISTQAQSNVYSANVVGYYNVTVPAGKFVLFGSQLNLDNTNSINNIFNGLASDAGGSSNTVIWVWNSGTSQYGSYQYFTGSDADNYFLQSGSVNGFYDGVGNLITANLAVGQAAFLQNLAPGDITVSLVGSVAQGTNVITLQNGYNLVSSPIPVSDDLTGTNLQFSGVSDSGGANNDVIWVWNSSTSQYGSYQYFNGSDADNYFLQSGSVNGFYDGVGNLVSQVPPVGGGFFIQRVAAGNGSWTNVFQVK